MKEFIEKLIARLEGARQECHRLQKTTTDAYGYMKQKQGIDVAKEIVKELAEEHGKDINVTTNSGWIPCSKVLPELDEWVLGQGLFGIMIVCLTETYKGEIQWMDINGDNRVIVAWQPLPQPYKSEEYINTSTNSSTDSAEWKQHLLSRFEGGEIR